MSIFVKCFQEIITIGHSKYQEYNLPLYRVLNWFATVHFICSCYYFLCIAVPGISCLLLCSSFWDRTVFITILNSLLLRCVVTLDVRIMFCLWQLMLADSCCNKFIVSSCFHNNKNNIFCWLAQAACTWHLQCFVNVEKEMPLCMS